MLTSPLKIEKRRIFINFALSCKLLFSLQIRLIDSRKKAAAKSSKNPRLTFTDSTQKIVCVFKKPLLKLIWQRVINRRKRGHGENLIVIQKL